MVTGLGSITMAAHEILRQVWIISIQSFMALDICAQSLVASYLGQVSLLHNNKRCCFSTRHLLLGGIMRQHPTFQRNCCSKSESLFHDHAILTGSHKLSYTQHGKGVSSLLQ